MTLNKLMVNRKRLFSAIMLAALIATIAVWRISSSSAQSVGGFGGAIFEVVPDATSVSSLPASGPFYIEGTIYPLRSLNPDGSPRDLSAPLGTWRAWGLISGGTMVTNQEYWLPSYNGTIEAQGVAGRTTLAIEGGEAIAVTGGLGTFRTAFGEAQARPFGPGPFRYDRPFRFELQETNRRPSNSIPQ